MEKTCSKCQEAKPLDEFYRDRKKAFGRQAICKACVLAQQAEYRARDSVKQATSERMSEYNKRPDVQERARQYVLENEDKIRAYRREYHASNRERLLRQARKYHLESPHVGWMATYRFRSRRSGNTPVVIPFTKDELISKYGDCCYYCGGSFDELDHRIPVSVGGEHSLDNCRPSCLPCNRAKRAEVPSD